MQVNTSKRDQITETMKTFRDSIITMYQSYETTQRFEKQTWDYKGEGGGEMGIIRGNHFEKAACNFSAVGGDTFPGSDGKGPFFATGVSSITHMQNPKAPTFHFNVRYIETENTSWIGGGFDMTPMGFTFDEDTRWLHNCAQSSLDNVETTLYPLFSKQAAKYFYIPHRHKERGVGGIFFDHFSRGDTADNLEFLKIITGSYLKAAAPIFDRRIRQPFSKSDKELQNKMRAHYVEFNLLYDRGTRFGFQSGGNPEAILCSMPPTACW